MNTLRQVQYCVNVVYINNFEWHEHLTIKKLCLANMLQYMYMRINSVMAAILMTSRFIPEVDLR